MGRIGAARPDGPAHRDGVPAFLSNLIGREREIATVGAALRAARLVTLTGAGGCGKTRLAAEVAGEWPGALVWVELAGLPRGERIDGAVARRLGIAAALDGDETQALIAELRAESVVIVLDNCEHVADGCAAFCQALLGHCDHVRVLATSRRALGLLGEVERPVAPLAAPAGSDGDLLHRSDAVRLFIDRARLVHPTFDLDEDTTQPVVEICRRLDGIPLAIELVAPRIRVLSAAEIALALEDVLGLVGRDTPTLTARQRTLRGSIDWSHNLLDADQRVLLRRLSVFVDAFTLPLVAEVCADELVPPDRIRSVFSSLVEQSLVQTVRRDPSPQFRLLDSVRQFAGEHLDAAGEHTLLRDRHREVMLALAEAQRAALVTGRARGRRGRPAHGWDSLTPTERDVVGHVAGGLTNPQIAALMFISRATVKTHLSHVYMKLDVSTRSALAVLAAQQAAGS